MKANRDLVAVHQATLEQAWTNAERIAVGMIISEKSSLDNEELSENIIMHSRRVIEDCDIL